MRLIRRGAVLAFILLAACPLQAKDTWLRLDSAHFTVFTTAPEVEARQWLSDMELFVRGLGALGHEKNLALPRVTVVLFGRDRDFRAYKPLENGKPAKMGGLFTTYDCFHIVALSLDNESDELRHLILHETTHWYFDATGNSLPLWFNEGLAELYSTFKVKDPTHVVFGTAIPQHVVLLNSNGSIPLRQLVTITSDSVHYNERLRTGIFYAESWAFVHYLVFGGNADNGKRLLNYFAALKGGTNPDTAFSYAMDATYDQMDAKLQEYLQSGRYTIITVPLDPVDGAAGIKAAPAKPADLEIALGELLLGTREPEDAAPHFRKASELAPDDPRPWEYLGEVALKEDNAADQISCFKKAVAAGSSEPAIYRHLAQAEYNSTTYPGAELIAPGATQTIAGAALDLLRHAERLDPRNVETYELYAQMVFSLPKPIPGDLELLQQGHRLAPANPVIAAGLGASEIMNGSRDEGMRRLDELAADPKIGSGPLDMVNSILIFETAKEDEESLNQIASLIDNGGYAKAQTEIAAALSKPLAPDMRTQFIHLFCVAAGNEAIELTTSGHPKEAIAKIDSALPQAVAPEDRATLDGTRKKLVDIQVLSEAQRNAQSGHRQEAKAALQKLLDDPDLEPRIRKGAQGLLEAINTAH